MQRARIALRGQRQSLRAARYAGAAFAIGLLGFGCTTPTDTVPVAQINLSPGLDSIEAGQVYPGFTVTMADKNGHALIGRQLKWTTANPATATVDESGQVTGVGVGQTDVTASVDGRSATSTIRVITPVDRILLTPDAVDVALTTTRALSVQLIGPNGEAVVGRVISWVSSNPAVATAAPSGPLGAVVTAVSLGSATITATAGTKTASAAITVIEEPVLSVVISPELPVQVVRLTQSFQLAATCYGASGVLPGRTVAWTSSNPSAVPVGPTGLVSGNAIGSATITANCGGRTAQITIQVTPIPVSQVTVMPPSVTLSVGQLQQLSAVAKDSAGNVLSLLTRQVIWTTDNLLIASVSGAGVVSGSQPGTANIQVTVDGVASNVVPVTVEAVPVASVQVTSPTPSPKVGTQTQLTIILRDANGSQLSPNGRQITWSSSDNNVATVSGVGLVTPLSTGPVTISATCEGQTGFVNLMIVP